MDPEELRHLKVAQMGLSGIEALMAVKGVPGLHAATGWESPQWERGLLRRASGRAT